MLSICDQSLHPRSVSTSYALRKSLTLLNSFSSDASASSASRSSSAFTGLVVMAHPV